MADSYNKKERDKKRRKKKQEKLERKRQKKEDGVKSAEFMYVDENGNLTATPPDPAKRRKINAEDIAVSTPKDSDLDPAELVKKGVVKFFNQEKRYGFIEEAISKTDYFVHGDNLIDAIQEKDSVEFELGNGPKGPIAVNVKKVKK
ncbi:MAG: cold shock domain-containing protein [Bacteroidota bacterium]